MRTGILLAIGAMLLASSALAGEGTSKPASAPAFKITKLVSNQSGKAKNTDANLVDAWGLSQAPGGPVWVSDNGTGLSTVYDEGSGDNTGIVVTIPDGNPTGQVYVPSGAGFDVTENGKTGASVFLFDSEAGVISGWSPSVDQDNAIIGYDSSANGSVYKGLALDTSDDLLFAADFANDQVQVFNNQFSLQSSFTDSSLKGYGPFNLAVINGDLYVAFAKQDKSKHDEIDKLGDGYIDVFSESGTLIKQLIAKGELDAPWGLAVAPSTFGSLAGDLLVGNFGNGWINAYDLSTGAYIGALSDKKGAPLAINGLWALDPVPSGDITFSAGPNKEKNGLLGLLTVQK
ncbi:MAG TPA: TIGR03118 family protein [Rhizomicrobium sp.]|nr:TIGR03118 family protein [Rhizomicrobium sp.]